MAERTNQTTWVAVSVWLAVAHGFGLAGCTDDHGDQEHEDGHVHDDDEEVGPPSGAVCPDGSTLTYENFGKPFVEDYCTRCHSSKLVGDAARNFAPEDHDFDTLEGIRAVANHIDQLAAAGPAETNTVMPLNDPKPSVEERRMLGEWLACETPE